MGAPDILELLVARGLTLRPLPDGRIECRPRGALTEELRALIREHRADIIAALKDPADGDPLPDAAAELRRQRVLGRLAEQPGMRYAVHTDTDDPAYPGCVVVGIGMRQPDGTIYTADMIVPCDRYDGFNLIDLLDRYNGTMH